MTTLHSGVMSVDHNPTHRRRSIPRWIAEWGLWSHTRGAVTLVLAVVTLGIGSAAVTALLVPIGRLDAIHFGLLAACALAHLETTRGIERIRKTAWPDGTTPHFDLRTVWNFAALVLLPPALATAMVLLTATHIWLRVRPAGKRRAPHRVVYTTATLLIANQLATALLVIAPGPFPGLPAGVAGVSLLIAAALVRWLINFMLVVGVIMLDNPQNNARQALGPLSVQALEAGGIFVAVAAVVFVAYQPLLLPILVVGLVAFHRCVLLVQFQHAASTDDKTGLLNSVTWTQLAKQELARAQRTGSTLGVLMIDLDKFKEINDTHGHPASDDALRAVAKALRTETREYDLAGRFGGDEFIVALPGVAGADLYAAAERLRHRIGEIIVPVPHSHRSATISGLTASIGGALYPATMAADNYSSVNGTATVDELIRAADSACYTAKRNGRDRIELLPDALRQHHLPVRAENESGAELR